MEQRLPELYLDRMKSMLGEDYQAYLDSFSYEAKGGLRTNRLKISMEDYKSISKLNLTPVSWIDNGCYYSLSEQPARHPHYYAGLYYIQEPSAMTPASVLPVEPGERVLDLCAAPGGKSTELAAKLQGKGVLVANDISNSRAKALLKNLELFGVRNSIIVSEAPAKLVDVFEGYFDKILVDAPCSGEGMFRKSPAVIKNWVQYGTSYYNNLQKEILPLAVKMLRPGGQMVYSTCTFSQEENEGVLSYILDNYKDMHVIPIPSYINETGKVCLPEGFEHARPEWGNGNPEIANAVRIWPHKVKGEGHFTALLMKDSEAEQSFNAMMYRSKSVKKEIAGGTEEFLASLNFDFNPDRFMIKDNRLYELPEDVPDFSSLRTLRSGLLIGEIKKDRFEPSQALAMALKMEDYDNIYNLSADDPEVIKYLKCETINIPESNKNGRVLICVDGYPLGWGKATNGILKNRYLAGWRWM